jgi:hypothetical protein
MANSMSFSVRIVGDERVLRIPMSITPERSGSQAGDYDAFRRKFLRGRDELASHRRVPAGPTADGEVRWHP